MQTFSASPFRMVWRKRQVPDDTPSPFSFTLTSDEWSTIFYRKKDPGLLTKSWASTDSYCNLFSAKFNAVKKGCVLRFKNKKVNPNMSKGGKFFIAYAKFSQDTCTARWSFHVEDRPIHGEDSSVKVRCVSLIKHSFQSKKFQYGRPPFRAHP